ncbi:Cytosolic iron-sulfur protein assembly protein [Cladophialophora chaetospira]|uniref:Probable cytosolic iron-sulfur protein assembly protein 1 n=1 Tax=Cladophialophora chaetospira TaxID=386627 RepID=A0AA38XGX0_9EURO|nr:Cytosolic iron-sulfur protein assembly protein [Cladophialophora chaetospira]
MTSHTASPESVPPLTLLHTLSHPSSSATRAWQSAPHPDPSIPLLATASADKSANIYSLKDFSLVSTISGGHKRSVRTVAWKDFGRQRKGARRKPVVLGTGSFDANVGVWVWNDERRRGVLSDDLAEDNSAEDAIETDMTNNDEDAEEWHFSTLLTGPDSEIKSIEFSPPHYPANLLATSSRDKSVWIWEEVEPEEWETIAVLSEHTGDVKCVGWCTGAQRRRSKRRRVQEDGDVSMGEEGGHLNGARTSNEVPAEDGQDEDSTVGARPLLASGSYDDTIRLWRDVEEEGDWICVAVIASHTGTVWDVKWEPHINYSILDIPNTATEEENTTTMITAFENDWQPRILSCSDDLSVRVWRRELSQAEKEKRRQQRQGGSTSLSAPMGFSSSRIPSVIRPMSAIETWVEDVTLPQVHVRSVYAVDWSKKTGLVVSCGGDGTIAVYREIAAPATSTSNGREGGDVVMNGTASDSSAPTENGGSEEAEPYKLHTSKWEVVALMEAAHDEFEINHVCWAERRDKDRRFVGEEMIVSTGDEGDVRIWTLPEELVKEFE